MLKKSALRRILTATLALIIASILFLTITLYTISSKTLII